MGIRASSAVRGLTALVGAAALLTCSSAPAIGSTGTPEQVAWVRRAARNYLSAELARNGEAACGVLAAPLRASVRGRSCAERWDGRIAALLARRGERALLRADRRASAHARVTVHGDHATIALPTPLLGASSRFAWSENCWMLEG